MKAFEFKLVRRSSQLHRFEVGNINAVRYFKKRRAPKRIVLKTATMVSGFDDMEKYVYVTFLV